MKKESNIKPEGLKKPTAPVAPPATKVSLDGMATVFNEWARRYADNPDEFTNILDSDGKPVEDYGESCAIYFDRLSRELGV